MLGTKIEFWGTRVLAEDSYMMFHCQGGEVEGVVRNSTVVNHFNNGSKKIIFENVHFIDSMKFLTCQAPGMKVRGVKMGEGGTFNHIFKNCTTDMYYLVVAAKKGRISGTIKFNQITLDNVHWEKGEITRQFPIKILDKNGKPYSKEIVTVNRQSLKTDEYGFINLEFNFNKSNYAKTREVIIETRDGSEREIGINFLTDTPIVL